VSVRADIDDLRFPWRSFAHFFEEAGVEDARFLTELNHAAGTREEWTGAEWRARVLATAEWLTAAGIGAGDAVATLAGNTADALALAFGSWLCGACCVPLNPADGVERHAYIVDHARAKLLVHNLDVDDVPAPLVATDAVLRATAELPTASADGEWRPTPAESGQGLEAPALRVYTSGTTGQPKGVVLTVRNLLTDCDALRQGLDWPGDTRVLTVLPVHHVNGLVISSLLPWYAGYSTVLCDRFRSDQFWKDVSEEEATVCSTVPSLLEFLLDSPGAAPGCFREILSGAGPLLTDPVIEFEDRFNVPVRHLYGLSETTAVVTLTPRLDDEPRRTWHRAYGSPSIGVPLPHAQVAIHDSDGRELPAGERGEIVVRGAMVMVGYAEMPQETADAFRGGWFHSGDEGFWVEDPAGSPYFFITGRIKELIIRGGANIAPLEVDAVLRGHPAVDFGLAVPFENRYYGEEIAAYVVTNRPVSNEEILAHCARYLDFGRQPKVVIQGNDVPFTATGKAKRLELKEQLAEALAPYRDRQFRRSAAPASDHQPVDPSDAGAAAAAGNAHDNAHDNEQDNERNQA
jgi:long-chain acyl-CoA synthetase